MLNNAEQGYSSVTKHATHLILPPALIYMAKGPHCADTVQDYLMKSYAQAFNIDDSENFKQETIPGSLEWNSGEIDLENLELSGDKELPDTLVFEELDCIYDSLKTQRGSSRIEGLEALASNSKPPKTGSTWWRWRNQYRDAGLTDENDNLTSQGEFFLNHSSTELSFDPGEMYRVLRTTSDSAAGQNSGEKIETFLLYGSGMSTTQVNELVDLPYESVRQTTQDLRELGLVNGGDTRLTAVGFDAYNTVVNHLNYLDDVEKI